MEQVFEVLRIRDKHRRPASASLGAARVRRKNTGFASMDVIDIKHRLQVERPGDRPKSGLTFKKVNAESQILLNRVLLTSSEKLRAVRTGGAHPARCRQAAGLKFRCARSSQVEENI